jgi:hypothetical protein
VVLILRLRECVDRGASPYIHIHGDFGTEIPEPCQMAEPVGYFLANCEFWNLHAVPFQRNNERKSALNINT